MKVIRLRTHYGVPALKGENSWGEGDPGTELRMLPCGHFVVSKYGKHTLIPGAAAVSADVEPDLLKVPAGATLPEGLQSSGVVEYTEPRRPPGRPKKEPVAT
jgi:hypothetical protein